MKYWSKSAISIYKYLGTMSKSIDDLILKIGKQTSNFDIKYYETIHQQTNRMIELMDRKRKIINLKVAVEAALNDLDNLERKILILTYVDGVKSETIADVLGISIRTFFRRKISALNNLCLSMIKLGFDNKFFEEYANEFWIISVHENFVIQGLKYENDELKNSIISTMLKNVTNLNKNYNVSTIT